tara:strand:- start:6594 stop:7190 length:597 start_codon:yes stop_codon:yes gene_type:complete
VSFWNNLFGKKKSPEEMDNPQSPFMPKKKDPIEISFASNFTNKGGKFLFVDSDEMAVSFFKEILIENRWVHSDIACLDSEISFFYNLDLINDEAAGINEKKILFIKCEFLIANTGGILISSNQIKNLNLTQLPENIIITANTKQFANDVSDGMSMLKSFYSDELPTNITTINPKNSNKESDFLTHGKGGKNIYLILNQ